MYDYLAYCQRTKLAVTAVHTDDEVTLYQMIVNDPQKRQLIKLHDQAKKPDFVAFAQLWSTFCTEELKIYFKTVRHLESYFNVMEDRRKYATLSC